MTLQRLKCCCGSRTCWHKLVACCTEADDLYITCAVATAAGIFPLGEGQNIFKYDGQCYTAEIFEEPELPEGAVVVGEEIIGEVEFYDDCGEDPGGCCAPVECWYVARRCCDVGEYCEGYLESHEVPIPPDEMYIACEIIDEGQVEEELPDFPITIHPGWYNELPDCIPCYTIEDGDTVDELPEGAIELGSQPTDEVVDGDCEAEECCPEVTGGCDADCAMPTHVILSVTTDAETQGDCPCDLPESPQAWKIGDYITTPFLCDGESATTNGGCKFRYSLVLECAPVYDGPTVIGVVYSLSIQWFNAATIGPDDPDCVVCGYTFPPTQTCADPCATSYTYVVETPTLDPDACPHPSDFTVVIQQINLPTAPTIDGFIW